MKRTKVFIKSTIFVLLISNPSYSQFISPLPPSIPADSLNKHINKNGKVKKILLTPNHTQAQLIKLYGNDALTLFSSFAGAVEPDDKRAFIMTEVVGGVLGRIRVSMSAAWVVSNVDADSASRKIINDRSAAITRLINNGGYFSAKLIYPLWAGGGSNLTSAGSLYGQGGLTSSPGDDPIGTAGIVGDALFALALRGDGQKIIAEILLAGRGGVNRVFKKFLGFNKQWVPFVQIGAGIRQNKKIMYSILWTKTSSTFQDSVSEWLFNLAITP